MLRHAQIINKLSGIIQLLHLKWFSISENNQYHIVYIELCVFSVSKDRTDVYVCVCLCVYACRSAGISPT